jgi:pyrroloquinoline-quinone synthase
MTVATDFLAAIDSHIASRRLLDHPFYQAWNNGTLTQDALREYAAQYYQHVAAFPTYLSAVHARTEDQSVRRHILQNLIDEEAGDPNHPELWLRFAMGLGLDPQAVRETEAWEETQGLIDSFRAICTKRPVVEGLAALYAYESQIPAVSETKIAGLEKHYGVTDKRTTAYFDVHIEADKEHAAVERSLLCELVTEENAGDVHGSVAKTLDALYEMLNGVCRRHNIAC